MKKVHENPKYLTLVRRYKIFDSTISQKKIDEKSARKSKISYFGQEVQGMTLGLCHGNANDKQSHISHIRHLDGLNPP